MPQTAARTPNTSPPGQQARLGYVPERIQDGGDATVTGPAGNRVITVDVQAILDRIGNTWGDILFRGELEWEVLGAGDDGFFLQTHGAGADPEWANVTVTAVPYAPATLGTEPIALLSDGAGNCLMIPFTP